MDLHEFGPDDTESIHAFVDLRNACLPVDSPWWHPDTPYRREMDMRHGWDGEPGRHFLGLAGGEVVAALVVHTSDYDNHDLAWLEVDVHPGHRRRGHGAAVLEAAYDVCRDLGRGLVGSDGWDRDPTHAFAAGTGFERKSQAILRRQHLAEIPVADIEKVHDHALSAAGDYELLRFEGRSPDDLLEALADVTASINDAPTDDLEIEDEAFPPERIRAYEEAQLGSGFRLYRLVARHRGTGELAGHTVVAVDTERPELGDQHDTAVVRAHRGHRLGALLKSAMVLDLLEKEPQVQTVDTWNAESNDHMIRVNEMLGYRVMGRGVQFQRRI